MSNNTSAITAAIVKHYQKPDNDAGGCLHSVLDDGNTYNSSVLFAIGYAIECGDIDAASLASAIYCLPKSKRRRVIRKASAIVRKQDTRSPLGILLP